MSGIKFYSEYDLACGWELKKIIKKINSNEIENEWEVVDVLDFYNIQKYICVDRFRDYLIQETGIDLKTFENDIKKKIGVVIGRYKDRYLDYFDEIDFDNHDDFFEILEDFKLYKQIHVNDFSQFLLKENVHIYTVLKFKRLTESFGDAVKEMILSESRNAETILTKYLGEEVLHLPSSLTEAEILRLIDEYIDSPIVNINVLRQIITIPTGKGLNIPDKIKLHAKRKAKEEEERIFSDGTGIESSVSISYLNEQDEAILFKLDGTIC